MERETERATTDDGTEDELELDLGAALKTIAELDPIGFAEIRSLVLRTIADCTVPGCNKPD